MTTTLHAILEPHVSGGAVPGAVALLARGDRVEVAAAGSVDVEGSAPMARDSIFRIASIHHRRGGDDARRRRPDRAGRPRQGWGFGGSVDVEVIDPWNVPGRYGWVGGTGTTAHLVPSSGSIAILLTQVAATDPVPPAIMRDFWRYAAA